MKPLTEQPKLAQALVLIFIVVPALFLLAVVCYILAPVAKFVKWWRAQVNTPIRNPMTDAEMADAIDRERHRRFVEDTDV